MKTPHIAQQLITSFATHGDDDRFISECTDKADRILTFGCDDNTTAAHYHFSDLSRVEFSFKDNRVSAFSPSYHFAHMHPVANEDDYSDPYCDCGERLHYDHDNDWELSNCNKCSPP